MAFCTVSNCMDGRVQEPVIQFMRERFDAESVDSITEAGPNLILAKQTSEALIQSIFDKLAISVNEHQYVGIGIAGYHDCAGNPANKQDQLDQLDHIEKSIQMVKKTYPSMEVIGLWISDNWDVEEVFFD